MESVFLCLLLSTSFPILFFHVINWESSHPSPPDPHLSEEKPVDEFLWQRWRLLSNRPFPKDSYEWDNVLCHEIMTHCQKHFDVVACPKGPRHQRLDRLAKCHTRNGNVTRFEKSHLNKIRQANVEKSKIGWALFAYDCQPNAYLHSSQETYSKVGVIFTTLCPVDSNIDQYPAAELMSSGGELIAINLPNKASRHDEYANIDIAQEVQAGLGNMLSKRMDSRFILSILMALSTLTYFVVFVGVSKALKSWKIWVLAVLVLLFAVDPIHQLIEDWMPSQMRRRVTWIVPSNACGRLVSDPVQYCLFYCYLLAIGKGILVAIEYVKNRRALNLLRIVAVWNQLEPGQPGNGVENNENVDGDDNQNPLEIHIEANAVIINEIVDWLIQVQQMQNMQADQGGVQANQDVLAAQNAVNNSTRVLDEDDGECPICLGVLRAGDTVTELACSQIALRAYHLNCINQWIQRGNHTCPCCRQPIGEGHVIQFELVANDD